MFTNIDRKAEGCACAASGGVWLTPLTVSRSTIYTQRMSYRDVVQRLFVTLQRCSTPDGSLNRCQVLNASLTNETKINLKLNIYSSFSAVVARYNKRLWNKL